MISLYFLFDSQLVILHSKLQNLLFHILYSSQKDVSLPIHVVVIGHLCAVAVLIVVLALLVEVFVGGVEAVVGVVGVVGVGEGGLV